MGATNDTKTALIEPRGSHHEIKSEFKRKTALKHGINTLRRAIYEVGGRVIDNGHAVGKALDAWRSDLIADLGGEDSVSTQQRALVDMAVRAKLLLDSVDNWLLVQPSLVTEKRKSLIPAVRQRVTLAHSLERHLLVLGLK